MLLHIFVAVAVTFPFWRAENFTLNQSWLNLNDDGMVTILQSGIYMIYAQVISGASVQL